MSVAPRRTGAAAAFAALALAACTATTPAPVIERTAAAPAAQSAPPTASGKDFYAVKKGDTLYSIALDHGHDYRDIAAWNNLENANVIKIGQQLRVTPPLPPRPVDTVPAVAVVKPVAPPVAVESAAAAQRQPSIPLLREPKGGKVTYSEQALAAVQPPATGSPGVPAPVAVPPPPDAKPAPPAALPSTASEDGVDWSWPLPGKVIGGFSEATSKGIDISGRQGEGVQAAAAGRVVYAGEGLRGYGKLVIIKHEGAFLSAYAHNSQILVKEGQSVSRGQRIAEVGKTDTDRPKLHFEIRRQGKPVDPLKYLPVR